MSKREEHLFEFSGRAISEAARREAEYHQQRLDHWTERREAAKAVVRSTLSAELIEQPVTGGWRYAANVKYGDQEAWHELQTATDKINSHQNSAERFEREAEVYGTQSDRLYELDTNDVHHFRLGGGFRED